MSSNPISFTLARRATCLGSLTIFDSQEPGVIEWLGWYAIVYLDYTASTQTSKRGRQTQALVRILA